MNSKKKIIIASIIVLSLFLVMNIPVDYLACSITPMACKLFDVVDIEDELSNKSIEVNDVNIELDIAFPEIQVGNMIYLTTSNDGSGRIFVATREGIVFFIEEGSNDVSIFIDIRNKIDQDLPGERGLLGFTFDPNYVDNGYFYIYYTDFEGNSIISRFENINNVE